MSITILTILSISAGVIASFYDKWKKYFLYKESLGFLIFSLLCSFSVASLFSITPYKIINPWSASFYSTVIAYVFFSELHKYILTSFLVLMIDMEDEIDSFPELKK